MKKTWADPRIEVQQFVPNEYVAACWGVACNYDEANDYEYDNGYWDYGNVSHRAEYCGSSTNQWVQDTDKDGTIDAMTETGTDGLGDLTCILYEDGTYENPAGYANVKVGDYIYWTTSSGNRTWHHQGTVTSNQTNRS